LCLIFFFFKLNYDKLETENFNINIISSTLTLPYIDFICTTLVPISSYSFLLIHIVWNVLKLDITLPPIHTVNILSAGTKILNCILVYPKSFIFLHYLSAILVNIVLPPAYTTLLNKVLLTSISMLK